MSGQTRERLFSADDERTLASVLDEIIPPRRDGRLPGAGELGLVDYLARVGRATPDLRVVIEQGLAAIRERSTRRNPQGFAALSRTDKLQVLGEIESSAPAFLPTITYHTFTGYYQTPRVLGSLGVDPHPPHPKGYEMEPNDLTLLDPVRRLRKLYREC